MNPQSQPPSDSAPEPDGTQGASWPEAVAAVRAFVAAREWAPFHDPKNLAMALASEAGELLAELRWVDNSDADRVCADPAKHVRVADELADVLIVALLLADRLGVDAPDVIRRKLAKNALKYPVEGSRGKADPPPPT